MSSHNTFIVYISGKVSREVKVHLYEQCVVAVLSAHIPIHCIYLGRFYMRSEVTHKSTPDYCVGIGQYYMGRFYMKSEVTHKSPPDYCVGKSVLHGKILCKNFIKSSHIK